MNHPKVTWLDGEHDAETERRLEPIYPLTEGIRQPQIRQLVEMVVAEYSDLVEEAFPEQLRQKYAVCDIQSAIRKIHAPKNYEEVEDARRRLVYQELFVLQLAVAIRRHRIRSRSIAPPIELTPKVRARILGRLPFELTPSQMTAFDEIGRDLGQRFPMNRLLHGEVGSGKTVVAVCAMMQAVAHGYQAAFMAPTEILANQHFDTVSELLANSRVRIVKWTGGMKTSERKQAAALAATGEAIS
jgi:ATP-dependent DNA helicase RecG